MKKDTKNRVLAGILSALLILPSLFSCAQTQPGSEGVNGTAAETDKEGYMSEQNNPVIFTSDRTYIPSSSSGAVPPELEGAAITALDTDGGLVKTTSEFELKTAGNIGDEPDAVLSKYIGVFPKSNFSVTKTSEDTYRIRLADEMESDTVYRFTIGSEGKTVNSFAFQTESVFGIKSTLPADLATDVPCNTGIELYFTEPLGMSAGTLSPLITVSGADGTPCKGRVDLYPNKKTAVFIPDDKLDTGSIYTVTVSPSVKGASGRELGGEYSFRFKTDVLTVEESEAKISFWMSDVSPVFSPGDNIVLGYSAGMNYAVYDGYANNELTDGNASVRLFRFSSREDVENAFRDVAVMGRDSVLTELGGLELSGEFDIKPEKGSYSARSLTLPELDAGVYIADVTLRASYGQVSEEYSTVVVIQVTDGRIYTQDSDGGFLVWMNSTAGADCSGKEIKLQLFRFTYGWEYDDEFVTLSGKTDGDGVAYFDLGGYKDCNYAILIAEDGPFYYTSLGGKNAASDYFCYAYTDREVYFSTDRVNIAGIIAPSHEGVELPGYITVKSSLSSVPVKAALNPDGSFTSSVEIDNYDSRVWWSPYYSITVPDGSQVFSDSFSVTHEDKPVYTATMEFDRLFYRFGESGKVTVKASFFDGTPASSLTFEGYFYDCNSSSTYTLVTDEKGEASFSFTLGRAENLYSTYPRNISANCYLLGLEDTNLWASADAYYFQSDAHLHAERTDGDTLTVGLHEFDTDRITKREDFWSPEFPFLGRGVRGSAKVTLVKQEYVKKYDGTTYYDPITKTTSKNWWYDTEYTDIWTRTFSFDGGIFTLDLLDREPGCWYTYRIVYRDAQNGADVEMNLSAQKYSDSTWYYINEGYTVNRDAGDKCADGEQIGFTVYLADSPLTGGRVFYSLYDHSGIVEKGVTGGSFSLTYRVSYLNGYSINTAVFDGRNYQTLYTNFPEYDISSNGLGVEIIPSSEETAPGETMTVKLRVSDSEGSPVSGGAAALSIVDEACFALGDQYTLPLDTYYSPRYCVSVLTGTLSGLPGMANRIRLYGNDGSYSYDAAEEEIMEAPMAMEKAAATGGMGGGAEDTVYVRETFADNPLFDLIFLDENGEAEVSFTVPDNITEWRVTAVAFSSDSGSENVTSAMRLGTSSSGVITTLPFFVNVSLSDTFVTGDDIAASAKVYGSAMTGTADVRYEAQVTDDAGSVMFTSEESGKSDEYAAVTLGKLDAGQYYLQVNAFCGEYSDGVRLPFCVVDDGIVMRVNRTVEPGEIKSINPSLYPVYVSFGDRSCADWLNVLFYISGWENKRLDSRVAAYAARCAYAEYSHTDAPDGSALRSEVNTGSILGILPYVDGDIVTTAKICAAVPELFTGYSKQNLISAVRDSLENGVYTDEKDAAAALLVLASLGEPVLTDLRLAAGSFTDTEAMLYIAAAFASAGDYSSASSVFSAVTAGYASSDGSEYFIAGTNTEESIALTAAALLSASVVSRENAPGMAKYIISHTSSLEIYTLELASFVRAFYPLNPSVSTVRYSVCGEERQLELNCGFCPSIALSKHELEEFEMLSYDEGVTASLSYMGGVTEALGSAGEASDGSIAVSKTIEPYNTALGLYMVTVKYTIKSDRDYISCTLTDRIPTGCRYYGAYMEDYDRSVSDRYCFGYLSNDGGQMMTGYAGMYNPVNRGSALGGRTERACSGTVSYLIRAAAYGSFAVSPAVIQNSETGSFSLSGSGSIVTSAGEWTVDIK